MFWYGSPQLRNNNAQPNIKFILTPHKRILYICYILMTMKQNSKLEKNLAFKNQIKSKGSLNFLTIRLLNRHQHAKIYQILLCGVNVNWTFRWASLLLVMTLLWPWNMCFRAIWVYKDKWLSSEIAVLKFTSNRSMC